MAARNLWRPYRDECTGEIKLHRTKGTGLKGSRWTGVLVELVIFDMDQFVNVKVRFLSQAAVGPIIIA